MPMFIFDRMVTFVNLVYHSRRNLGAEVPNGPIQQPSKTKTHSCQNSLPTPLQYLRHHMPPQDIGHASSSGAASRATAKTMR